MSAPALLKETFRLFGRHAGLFLAMTAVVAVPFAVIRSLIWGEYLNPAGFDFAGGSGPEWATVLLLGLIGGSVIPAVVTALHVAAVLRIQDGERPSVRDAFGLVRGRTGAVTATAVLYFLGVALGAFVLVGYWWAVRWYFGAQLAVVERRGPRAALERSGELVQGRWWRTAGLLLLAWVALHLLLGELLRIVIFVDYGVLYVALRALATTVSLSLGALFGTLLFLDYWQRPAAGGSD